MATTAYTIKSHYDPVDRERLEQETGQSGDITDSADVWDVEAQATFKRKLAPPPHFVPAGSLSTLQPSEHLELPSSSLGIAGWYKSLPRAVEPTTVPSKSLASDTHPLPRSSIKPPPPETRTKNNWFIQNVLSTQPVAAVAPPPTLADILARDPPPLPHEPQHSPPIWLAIGPSNKGYEMLQNRGWNEGEALGIGVLRANRMRPEPEVIDLTEPDRDPESDDYSEPEIASASGSSSRTALVTPIATVLKSDRLGIGLKAKTVGPYRASQKRVTHNAAAMLAHVKAAEELRKQKRRYGRGYRGHARQEKAQNRQRREMLAYLNEP